MDPQRFKIATFNLLNLVLPEVTYYGNRRYSHEDFVEKKDWLAAQLGRMDADIIGFQEVFHEQALKQVLAESGVYHKAAIRVANETGAGPVVGLVSRFPLVGQPEVITAFPESVRFGIEISNDTFTEFSRPVLKARIRISDQVTITVFVVHLKSKRPKYRDNRGPDDQLEAAIGKTISLMRRALEATALRAILLETMRGNDEPVIVLGDVNDTGVAVTSEIITGSPPWRFADQAEKEQTWDVLLYNVKDILARQSSRDVYYTHLFNGHYESLDHIMVSQELYHRNPDRIGVVEYVSVFNDHLIDETLSRDRIPFTQSDHGQVVVTLRLQDR